MRNIALSGAMFGDDILAHLEAAGKAGYKGVELRGMGPLLSGTADESFICEIEAIIKKYNLSIPTFSTWMGDYALLADDDAREKEFERADRFFKLAKRLGIKWLRVNATRVPPKQAEQKHYDLDQIWMRKVADLAKSYDLGIYIEMHHGSLCDTPEHTLKYLKMVDRDNVGIIVDPYNFYQVPAVCDKNALSQLLPYIVNIHVKDLVSLTDNTYPYSFEYEAFIPHAGRFIPIIPETQPRQMRYFANRRIGFGGIDWYHILTALDSLGYKGFLTVESTNGGDKHLPKGLELAQLCIDDLNNILDEVGGSYGSR